MLPCFEAAITAFRERLAMPEKDLLAALEIMSDALDAAYQNLTTPVAVKN